MAKITEAELDEVQAICQQIIPLFMKANPNVVGCVLGEMVGTYLAGFHPSQRDDVRNLFDDMVDSVVEVVSERSSRRRRQQ